MGHFSQFWTQWWRKGPNDTFILVRSAIAAHNIQTQYRLSKELLQTVQGMGMPVGEGLRLRQAYADAAGQGTVVWRMNTESAKAATAELQFLFQQLLSYESNPSKHVRGIAAANPAT